LHRSDEVRDHLIVSLRKVGLPEEWYLEIILCWRPLMSAFDAVDGSHPTASFCPKIVANEGPLMSPYISG